MDHLAWFRRLLRLLPADFQADYARDMERTFDAQQRDARRSGGWRGVAGLWWETLADLLRTAPREHFDQLSQDTRYALRMMARTRGLTAIAVFTLATGIGANTAIFSVVHAVLLRELPYGAPDRLAMLWNRWPGSDKSGLSYPELLDFRERLSSVEIAGWARGTATLLGRGEPERLVTAAVSPNLLDVLGVRPALGRPFLPEEERSGHDRVVILSHGLWQQRFGGDPSVIGQVVRLGPVSSTIVGVLPPGFILPNDFGAEERSQILEPLTIDVGAPRAERGGHFLRAAARIRPDYSLAQAQAEVDAMTAAWLSQYQGEYDPGYGATLWPVRTDIVGDVRPALLVLSGAVGLVLLIACANVANLLLARAQVRAREIALRKAIGASRGRLARQVITESLVLATTAGAAGVAIAYVLMEMIARTAPAIPRLDEVRLDPAVLAFTAGITMLTGLVFGTLPALDQARGDVAGQLQSARGGGASARRRSRATLVAVQMAMALVLLIGAALLLQSFARLMRVPAGISPEHVLSFRVALPPEVYPERAQVVAFFERLAERMRVMPGVRAAGAVTNLPLGDQIGDWDFYLPGETPGPHGSDRAADWQVVTAGYFEAMGVPLRRGRFFTARDGADAPAAVIVNETLADTYFAGRDPIGLQIRMSGGERPWMTVVGVVADVRHDALDAPAGPQLYMPHAQFVPFWSDTTVRSLAIVLRGSDDAEGTAAAVRTRVRELDPTLAVAQVRPMARVLERAIAPRRLQVELLTAFAAIAVVLALVGTYGVLAFQIAQRTREFGIRMALGAAADDILRLVIRDGMVPAAAGVVIGLAGAAALTRVLRSLLFETEPLEPLTFGLTAAALLTASLAACAVPARRATRVDPSTALRAE